MAEELNPYQAPAPDKFAELRLKRRRRNLIAAVLSVAFAMALFAGYAALQVLFIALNEWLFGP